MWFSICYGNYHVVLGWGPRGFKPSLYFWWLTDHHLFIAFGEKYKKVEQNILFWVEAQNQRRFWFEIKEWGIWHEREVKWAIFPFPIWYIFCYLVWWVEPISILIDYLKSHLNVSIWNCKFILLKSLLSSFFLS